MALTPAPQDHGFNASLGWMAIAGLAILVGSYNFKLGKLDARLD